MPTNVTPEYKKAEEAYRQAKTLDEKIERLEEMIAFLPKHKGTDHLFADLKRRLSSLKRELETSDRKAQRGSFLEFDREGAAQVVLTGPPSSGKSSILKALTNAHPEIGDYPFTTHRMQPGMVPYKDIQIQLVDTPPVTADYMPRHLLSILRSADGALLTADLSKDTLLDELEDVLQAFSMRHLRLVREKVSESRDEIRTLIIANKVDSPDALTRLELLREMTGGRLDIAPVSCKTGERTAELPAMLFEWLKIVRVYTKIPGEKPDLERPYTVFGGRTVGDIGALIHRDFADKFRFARLWRGSGDPITVSRHEPVMDGDILELHI